MAKKSKSLYSRFQDNYTAVVIPAENKKGRKTIYVYYAPWYVYDLPGPEFRRKKAIIAGLELLSLLVFILFASLYAPVNAWKGSLAFTAFGTAFQVMEFGALVDLMTAKTRTTKIKYENISRSFAFFTFMRACLFALGAVFCAVYTIAVDFSTLSMAVAAGYLICAALAWMTRKIYKAIPFYTEENDALKKYGINNPVSDDIQ